MDEVPALRLGVLDAEDLAVVSAHLQSGEVRLSEMAYLPREHRFALIIDRFDWPLAARGSFARCRSGLHFERVLGVSRNRLADVAPDQPLTLMAIAFVAEDPPSGAVLLTFMGGGQIRLRVECIEAEMRDIGPRWSVEGSPERAEGEGEGERGPTAPAR